MKFARYLQDAQTPEWKKAYIDYRGLKKCIAAIRELQEEHATHFCTVESPPSKLQNRISVGSSTLKNALGLGFAARRMSSGPTVQHQLDDDPVILIQRLEEAHPRPSQVSETSDQIPTLDRDVEATLPRAKLKMSHEAFGALSDASPAMTELNTHHPQVKQRRLSFFQPSLKASKRRRHFSFISHGSGPRDNHLEALPLPELYRILTPQEQQFFMLLDAELQKVDSFYAIKEEELQIRTQCLSEQLKELANHRRVVCTTRPSPRSWIHVLRASLRKDESPFKEGINQTRGSDKVKEDFRPQETKRESPPRDSEPIEMRRIRHSKDFDDYLYAKRKIEKAVVEHFRGIETLVNYRILNLTGFRKALKKFEKVTRIPVQVQYMSEKVEKSTFCSDRPIQQMMLEMERLYAQAFMRNNTKKAREYLRGGGRRVTSHHFSTFRSGLFLGVALPLLISALYELSQNKPTHSDAILHLYGILSLPAIFPILISLNIFVWSYFHINYVFIFELDTRTLLDYHKYLELPCLLFAALCFAMWMSFTRTFSGTIEPEDWPLVWLGFVAFMLFNPFRFWFKDSRYWLLKLFGQLFLSGTRPVEFSNFWLADQLCSFNYTLSGLAYLVCAYTVDFDGDDQKCGYRSKVWPIQWALTSLPLFIRLVQCIRRYFDSGLTMHIMNAGRYASGIISVLFFYLWRQSGATSGLLAAWCMINTAYSIYSCIWDSMMDWSMLSFSSKHPLLRDELVYVNYIYVYHVSLIVNVILRFAWVLYIPQPNSGWDIRYRSFVVGFLEIIRRVQWNFFRLENEHLGNVDQYRITREVPLPYTFDDKQQLEELDDEKSK